MKIIVQRLPMPDGLIKQRETDRGTEMDVGAARVEIFVDGKLVWSSDELNAVDGCSKTREDW
jgi:hypothetical protein